MYRVLDESSDHTVGIQVDGKLTKEDYDVLIPYFDNLINECGPLTVLALFSNIHGALAAEGESEKGRALYVKYCEVCHGPEGKGDGYLLFDPPVANLTSPSIQKKSEAELWRSVRRRAKYRDGNVEVCPI